MTVAVDDVAPDFELPDQHGTPIRLSALFRPDAAAARAVLLVFFPWAFSSVCTGELAALREDLPAFEEAGVAVLGISVDSTFVLRAFTEHEGLSVPLLSDFWPHGGVAEAYGVFDAASGAARRTTFLIDADRLVRWRTAADIGSPRDHAEYRAAVDRLAGAGA